MAGKNGSEWFHDWIPRNAAAADLKAHRAPGSPHSGLVFKATAYDDGSGQVSVHRPGRGTVGNLNYGKSGRVDDVFVTPAEQRNGIAAALYKRAQRKTGGKIRHSADRTAAGNGFARAMGGVIPPRSRFRGK